jgi:hypothetical protein
VKFIQNLNMFRTAGFEKRGELYVLVEYSAAYLN